MWVMTHFGILMPSLRPIETFDPAVDDRHIQVRARRSRELNYLRRNYAPWLGDTIFIGDTDYQYRAYCTHAQLGDIMTQLSLEIDYVKFKPTTDRHNDTTLHSVYNRIWSVVLGAWPAGSSYDEPWPPAKARGKRTKKSKNKNLAARVAAPFSSRRLRTTVTVEDVGDDGLVNEYARGNRNFRKQWWEDLGSGE